MKKDPRREAHYVLKSSQEALKGLKSALPELVKAQELIRLRKGNIVVTGIGKSGFVGQKLAATLTSLGIRAVFLHPVEAIHGDIGAIGEGDALVALSYSGESKEVVKLVSYVKKHFNVSVTGISKNTSSTLGQLSDAHITLRVDREGSPHNIAPMASTTASMVVGDMLAAMLVNGNFKKDAFARLHPGGNLGLELTKVASLMKVGASVPKVRDSDHLQYVLQEMTDKKLGVVAVINSNKKIVGVITDGDIRRWLLKNRDIKDAIARTVMTRKPKTIYREKSLRDALRIMEDHRITTLFVVDTPRELEGIIHIHDIVEENIV